MYGWRTVTPAPTPCELLCRKTAQGLLRERWRPQCCDVISFFAQVLRGSASFGIPYLERDDRRSLRLPLLAPDIRYALEAKLGQVSAYASRYLGVVC